MNSGSRQTVGVLWIVRTGSSVAGGQRGWLAVASCDFEAISGLYRAIEETAVLQKELWAVDAACEVQPMPLVTRGVNCEPCFGDGVPFAAGVADPDIPIVDSTCDVSCGGVKVFEERVEAFECGVGLRSSEAGDQLP